jgi:hypothetical protein
MIPMLGLKRVSRPLHSELSDGTAMWRRQTSNKTLDGNWKSRFSGRIVPPAMVFSWFKGGDSNKAGSRARSVWVGYLTRYIVLG